MKRGRRVFAIIVALCVAVGMVAWPTGGRKVRAAVLGDYEYGYFEDGTINLMKYNGTDARVTVPEEIEGRVVSQVWPYAFENCTGLEAITLPSNITRVGSDAFKGCTSLTEVHFSNSMTEIEWGVFEGCTRLGAISIPDYITAIGGYAFKNCTGLVWISIPDNVTEIGAAAFAGCDSLAAIRIPSGVSQIYSDTFKGCVNLAEISIPNRVTIIGNGAFANCDGLEKVHISDSVEDIDNAAFKGCTSLKEISIPDHVANIGSSTFRDCTELGKISIPVSVANIGSSTFYNCSSLTDVYYSGTQEQWDEISIGTNNECLLNATIHFNNNSTDVPSQDYEYQLLDDGTITISRYIGSSPVVNIPLEIDGKPVASIQNAAFRNCERVREISIPENITSIGASAFNGCTSLTECNILGRVPAIRSLTFAGCINLTNINIPNGVTTIGLSAFSGCAGLEEVRIPDSVETIDPSAFYGCTRLTQISIPNHVTNIGISCFMGCIGLEKISIADSVVSIGGGAFEGCSNLTDVYYSGTQEQWDEIRIAADNECLLNATIHFNSSSTDAPLQDYEYQLLEDETIQITKYIGSSTVANIPSEINGKRVVVIGDEAFKDCTELTEVNISNSVTSIGNHAFEGCIGLAEVNIPNSVTSIGTFAFEGCIGLTEVSIPNSVTIIGACAFSGCTGLTEISIPNSVSWIQTGTFIHCTGLEKISIPENITSIEMSAFEGCTSLTECSISSRVSRIQSRTFFGCINLTNINIPNGVTAISLLAFGDCTGLTEISIPNSVTKIGGSAFVRCTGLTKVSIPNSVTSIAGAAFAGCTGLTEISIPTNVTQIGESAFARCSNLADVYYSGIQEQWDAIQIDENNEPLRNATLHYQAATEPDNPPQETLPPGTADARQELERLKAGDPLQLAPGIGQYLSEEQLDIVESCLFTWLADVNYAYQYAGSAGVKERVRKKAGIDPEGDFAAGTERAITHISVETVYGPKTFEFTLDLGKPDSSGNLYPAYGTMHYEVLEKSGIPSDVPKSGTAGQSTYTGLGPFVSGVSSACGSSLHSTYQWQSLSDTLAAGVLIDKTTSELIGNRNGSFSDGTFTVYVRPLFTYSKKVTIACPVDVYVYGMDGTEAGSIVGNQPESKNRNVRLDVSGDTKTVFLTGDDYYLNLRGTDTGTMKYEVEEIANDEVRRNVEFLELKLEKDMQYEGYVFRPLNIDKNLYALRTTGSSSQAVYPDSDSYQPIFKKVQGMSLSQQNTSLNTDKTVQLNASLFPLDASNPNLQWVSDDPSVASVGSDGLVTAVGAGRATITVMTRDGSFLKESCIIDVTGGTANPPVQPDTPTQPGGTPSQPDTPTQPGGTPSQPGTPTQPGGTPSQPGTPTQPGGTTTQPGTSTQPGTGSTTTQPGTTTPGTQPNQPSTQPPQDNGPVVDKLYYVLQFHANGGMNLSRRTMTLLNNDSPGILPKVQRKAYTFDGWYTQQDGGAQVSGDKPLDAATTLYARWSKTEAPAKPASPKLVSKKKGQLKVTLSKAKGAAGYQVVYSTSKKFAKANTKKMVVGQGGTDKKTATGIKPGKTYYVKVRAYSLDSMGNKVYGKYSAVKSIKVKA